MSPYFSYTYPFFVSGFFVFQLLHIVDRKFNLVSRKIFDHKNHLACTIHCCALNEMSIEVLMGYLVGHEPLVKRSEVEAGFLISLILLNVSIPYLALEFSIRLLRRNSKLVLLCYFAFYLLFYLIWLPDLQISYLSNWNIFVPPCHNNYQHPATIENFIKIQ